MSMPRIPNIKTDQDRKTFVYGPDNIRPMGHVFVGLGNRVPVLPPCEAQTPKMMKTILGFRQPAPNLGAELELELRASGGRGRHGGELAVDGVRLQQVPARLSGLSKMWRSRLLMEGL